MTRLGKSQEHRNVVFAYLVLGVPSSDFDLFLVVRVLFNVCCLRCRGVVAILWSFRGHFKHWVDAGTGSHDHVAARIDGMLGC